MTNDIAIPSGHLGNLTSDQIYKLKEMYLAILVVLGAPGCQGVKVGGSPPAPEKKGGHFGFGSKKVTPVESLKDAEAAMKETIKDLNLNDVKKKFRIIVKGDAFDSLVLRFLRARKWDVVAAAEMFGHTLHWRTAEYDLEELLVKGERYWIEEVPDEGFINQYKDGKAVIAGRDKFGRPIVTINVRKHDPRAQTEEAMERFTLFNIETSHLCLTPNVETAAIIFDLNHFGLHNMDYAIVKFILKCFEAHYPESLGFIFIHRAPWIFSTVWNLIKGWIDPVVAAKISFTKNEKDLLKRIDSDQLPKNLGGTLEHEYKWIPPAENEDKPMQDTETRDRLLQQRDALADEFDELTLKWIQASGSEADKLFEQRQVLSNKLSNNYWQLDPYIRARTVYDRNGILGEFRKELAPGGVAQPCIE